MIRALLFIYGYGIVVWMLLAAAFVQPKYWRVAFCLSMLWPWALAVLLL